MASSLDILAAAADPDLLARATARAAAAGVVDPTFNVGDKALALVLAAADSDGALVADKYAYAAAVIAADLTYAEQVLAEKQADVAVAQANVDAVLARETPGRNLAAVTDEHLDHAIAALITAGVLIARPAGA